MYVEIIYAFLPCFCIVFLIVSFLNTARKFLRPSSGVQRRLPPGPEGLPFFGNLHQVGFATDCLHTTFTKLAKTHGGIFTIKLGPRTIVVISDIELGKEALIRQSRCFAGRPPCYIGDALLRGSKDIGFQDYTPTWKSLRKVAHAGFVMFNEGKPEFTENIISKEVDELCARLREKVNKPIDLYHDVGLAIMNVICAMLLGVKYNINDPNFHDILDYHEKFVQVVGKGQLLNAFPFLRHFPLKIVKDLNEFVRRRDACLNTKYEEHVSTYQEGQTRDIMDALIKAKLDAEKNPTGERQPLDDDHLIMTAYDMFGAGSETVAVFIRWLIALLVAHPEVQEKVHKEFDEAFEPGEIPCFSDSSRLHYFKAMIHEVLRIQPVVALGLPHRTLFETTLGGYNIPQNTTVIFNIWGMNRDSKYWKEPLVFDPTRFLDNRRQFKLPEPGILTFSAGKRACLGEALARKEIFLFASRLLHEFSFSLPPGDSPPDFEGVFGLNLTPEPYQVIMSARLENTKVSTCKY